MDKWEGLLRICEVPRQRLTREAVSRCLPPEDGHPTFASDPRPATADSARLGSVYIRLPSRSLLYRTVVPLDDVEDGVGAELDGFDGDALVGGVDE